jgi:hypothetical protein
MIARWAKLNPATPREETGRGKKLLNQVEDFSHTMKANYRKVGEHGDKIDAYDKHQKEKKLDEEMSVKGFIRFVTGTEKAGTAAHVSENTGVPEWYTPQMYVEAVRKVLGDIDLDPATSELAQKLYSPATTSTMGTALIPGWRVATARLRRTGNDLDDGHGEGAPYEDVTKRFLGLRSGKRYSGWHRLGWAPSRYAAHFYESMPRIHTPPACL